MRGEGMYQRVNDCLRRFDARCSAVGSWSQWASIRSCGRPQQKHHRASCLAGLLLVTLTVQPILAQEQSSGPSKSINANIATLPQTQQQTPAPPTKRPITISDAVSIFLQQNLQLVASRYDIDTVEAEKLTARLRPNPEISVGFSDIPLSFRNNFIKPQTFNYDISQTFELGGKRKSGSRPLTQTLK